MIGIDDYSASRTAPQATGGTGGQRGLRNLDGAVNDVREMREMLVAGYGFAPQNILTLTDQKATREAILQAIDHHLTRPSQKGDTALFYFSGHGSQVENLLSEEPDHLDESLVPADSLKGAPDIRDKELRRFFNRILDRGVALTIVLDSCHSGSGVRDLLSGARFRGVKPDRNGVKDGEDPGPRPEDRGALVLSAAQDTDRAWETEDENGQAHGAFSLALLRSMRNRTDGESAEETFLRARARLQFERRFQEPVLAGSSTARHAPLLGSGTGQRSGRTVAAVERVEPSGAVILQGGWANGLTVGSELQVAIAGPGPGVRLAVTGMRDLSRCEARIVSSAQRSAPTVLQPGMLAEVVSWAAPPGVPLRVLIPSISSPVETVVALAQELAGVSPQKGVRWIEDPTEEAPTHILRWQEQGWEILDAAGEVKRLGPETSADAVLAKLTGKPASLFVQLPSPAALVKGLVLGPGTAHSGVETTDRPERADFVLVGRLSGGSLEYAWLRSDAGRAERRRTGLPVRTDWQALGAQGPNGLFREAVLPLQEAVLRLRKIQSWQHLEPPPGSAFGYELAVRRQSTDALITNGILLGQETYTLLLRARRTALPASPHPRYVYVFVVDSYGRSVLLFPTSGSVENRLPQPASERPSTGLPAEISLGPSASFRATAPFGVDSYFLLTADEPLPNPWILEWEGVRTRGPQGETPLEELLSLTGGSTRSATPVLVPMTWSIETKLFESVPPGSGATPAR